MAVVLERKVLIDSHGNRTLLGGFDANGQSVLVEADKSYFFHHKYN